MKEQTLFKEKPLRKRNGRYCTKEQFRQEKVDGENKVLRHDVEKYKRAWLSVVQENTRLRKELKEIKQRIKSII